MNKQPFMVRPIKNFIVISPDRYDGNCNTVEDPFGRICVPNEIEDVNLNVINMTMD